MRSTVGALAVASAMILAACGGGGHGGSSGSVIPQTQAPSSGSPMTFAWGKQIVAELPYVGPAQSAGLSLAVMVRMRNPQGLLEYAASANNPASPNYRHWLTPAQIASQYGASTSDYQTVASYFQQFGLQVGAWPQREMLTVSGSTQQFSKAFGTTFGVYTYLGKKIVAPNGTPSFSSTLPIVSAIGLIGAPTSRTFIIHNNNAMYYGYSPQQIATGFDYSGAFSAGYTGSGINVGIIGTGPILNSGGTDDDVAAYGAYWKASVAPITQVAASPQPASSANGQTGTTLTDTNPTELTSPPPLTAPCTVQEFPEIPNYNTCNPEDGEAQLDTESVAGLAPGASVLFYLAYNANEYCVDPTTEAYQVASGPTCPSGYEPYAEEGLRLSDDEIQQAIADDKADSLSLSYGESENDAAYDGYIEPNGSSPGLGQVEFASLAAEGIAVFASSGDNGAWECFNPANDTPLGTPCVSYPASDPNVVAVGGVNVPLDESGNLTGAITAWADNTTLGGNGSFSNDVGSGGGVSAVFTPQPWQSATIGNTMRELPDVSLDADPLTGPSIVQNAGFSGYTSVSAVGGTSVSAPEAAAQWALVLQACKSNAKCNTGGTYGYRLGNPAAYFYAIYATSQYSVSAYAPSGFTPQLSYAQVFYDVIYGDNQAVPATPMPGTPSPSSTPSGYESGPGYDQVTGLGVPFTGHLIQAVTGTTVP
jgi:subtilase family serine protease